MAMIQPKHATSPLPNFLIAGATRSGTTSLYGYLRAHPDVFIPAAKELSFFDRDQNYQQELAAYRRHFAGWSGERAVGEASPMYWVRGMTRDDDGQHRFCMEDDAGRRLATRLPNINTIISLRDPVQRAYSQYWRNRWLGREKAATFLDALYEEQAGMRPPKLTRTCWIYHNRYTLHLERWFELFPRNRVKVLIFEEWTKSPEETLRELFQFLGVDTRFRVGEFAQWNAGWEPRSRWWARRMTPWLCRVPGLRRLDKWNRKAGYAPLSRDIYLRGREIFASEINALEALLGQPLDVWQYPG